MHATDDRPVGDRRLPRGIKGASVARINPDRAARAI
jgi:hypothetical protein